MDVADLVLLFGRGWRGLFSSFCGRFVSESGTVTQSECGVPPSQQRFANCCIVLMQLRTVSTQLGLAFLAAAYSKWCIYIFIVVLMQLVLGTVSTQLGRASLAAVYCKWCIFLFISF
jgi:hypothetical protein